MKSKKLHIDGVEWITKEEGAARLGISKRSLERMIARRELAVRDVHELNPGRKATPVVRADAIAELKQKREALRPEVMPEIMKKHDQPGAEKPEASTAVCRAFRNARR